MVIVIKLCQLAKSWIIGSRSFQINRFMTSLKYLYSILVNHRYNQYLKLKLLCVAHIHNKGIN
jgi:hypothetical protein